MRVDETWDEGSSADIDSGVTGWRVRRSSDPCKGVVHDHNGGVRADAERVRAGAVAGHELVDSRDHCAAHPASS